MVPSCQNKVGGIDGSARLYSVFCLFPQTLPAFGTVLKPHEKMKDGPLPPLFTRQYNRKIRALEFPQENYRVSLYRNGPELGKF